MTAATRVTYAARMPERELQQLVGDLCKLLGLPHFHVRHSRGMTAGWPDSVIIGTRVIYRELKAEHASSHPTNAPSATNSRQQAPTGGCGDRGTGSAATSRRSCAC
jgi:hypothetical protein